ncbi:DUF1801 domain-containing protein [Sediminicola sp. 1XM1-17]|uniref:DUF1801 domain-containing protein n=1 Tax=Sediminicola sp. 1XM1-17 TaxID=3127702 RepID=UPI00307885AA
MESSLLKELYIHTDPKVHTVFEQYPKVIRKKLMHLRSIIIETAMDMEKVTRIDETLKWGEPSYLVGKGSTLRICWKPKTPSQNAVYFKCTSALVPTFKKLYDDIFTFEGNRAITFQMEEKIPIPELKNCIRATLRYHLVKNLPTLGI